MIAPPRCENPRNNESHKPSSSFSPPTQKFLTLEWGFDVIPLAI